MQIVELVGMFLGDDRAGLVARFEELINEFSASEKFEAAASLRDIMIEIDRFWNDSRRRVWLSDAVDTYAVEKSKQALTIFLVTHRGRKVLGRKVFTTTLKTFGSSASALSHLIDSFYLFHLPKEIRIPERLPDISALQDRLSRRFGRPATITVSNPAKKGVNAFRGLNLSHSEHLLDRVKPIATPQMISSDLKAMFGLTFRPKRVEAFDVAHISGTNFAAAWAVWEEGRFQSADYRFLISDKRSEPEVLANAVLTSIIDGPVTERLILLDGGIGQLNKVLVAVADRPHPPVAAAVKPRGKHSSIAAFLTSSGSSIPFNVDSPTHSMLQLLRDEAHDLANRVHRDYREMLPFYEAKGFDRPLVVPLRFHEIDGGADDLIPIDAK